jgi:hypothetical protein
MTYETLQKDLKKFSFDVNIFDDGEDGMAEDQPPPPPVYDEADLEQAKKAAFQSGFEQAHQEAKDSNAAHISKVLDQIAQSMSTLFEHEARRDTIYEQEAVRLALKIFEKMFPDFEAQFGFETMKNHIGTVLKSYEGTKTIQIAIHPELSANIDKFLQKIAEKNPKTRFEVTEDDSLALHACKLRWADGGAVRDPDALAEEIHKLIQQTLAGEPTTGHDSDETQIIAESSEHRKSEQDTEADNNAGPDTPESAHQPDDDKDAGTSGENT